MRKKTQPICVLSCFVELFDGQEASNSILVFDKLNIKS